MPDVELKTVLWTRCGCSCDHLSGPVRWDTLGSAYYQLGELHRLHGEFAEESYRKASASGRPPEPGLALLRLAKGRIDVATGVLRRTLDETQAPPERSRLLPAYAETMTMWCRLAPAPMKLARSRSSLTRPTSRFPGRT